MYKEKDFEQIRPYHDHEINGALKRIVASPIFDKILEYLRPEKDKNQIKSELTKINTAIDFQRYLMYPLVKHVVKYTSDGLTSDGFNNLTPGTSHLFLANHRDIVLDSAILQLLLFENNHETSEITFGSNLMTNQFIIDFGKVNRMFVVTREGNGRELFKNSQLLSAYIRYTITTKHVSTWIAQRNGRTKDGNDKTEPGLLKMFNISGKGNFKHSFQELNIVPIIVSYEYEPCCALKIKELSIKLQGLAYKKKPNEDFTSIITGITQPKGRIHFSVGLPVHHFIEEADAMKSNNERIGKLTELIDAEIYKKYRLWPNNYIAHDMMFDKNEYAHLYTKSDWEKFSDYMQGELKEIDSDETLKKELFLKIYATPVVNANKFNHIMKS